MRQNIKNIWRILKWASREIYGEFVFMVKNFKKSKSDDHYHTDL